MARTEIVIACLVVSGATGCATAFSLSAAPSVDTKGHFGTEERIQVQAAAGDSRLRFLVGLGGGVGYSGSLQSGTASVQPEVGVEGGGRVQWSATGFFAPRFVFRGTNETLLGGGSAGQVLFRVKGMGGESGSLLVGSRLSTEVVEMDPTQPNGKGAAGVLSLALVLRWVTFDTTEKSW